MESHSATPAALFGQGHATQGGLCPSSKFQRPCLADVDAQATPGTGTVTQMVRRHRRVETYRPLRAHACAGMTANAAHRVQLHDPRHHGIIAVRQIFSWRLTGGRVDVRKGIKQHRQRSPRQGTNEPAPGRRHRRPGDQGRTHLQGDFAQQNGPLATLPQHDVEVRQPGKQRFSASTRAGGTIATGHQPHPIPFCIRAQQIGQTDGVQTAWAAGSAGGGHPVTGNHHDGGTRHFRAREPGCRGDRPPWTSRHAESAAITAAAMELEGRVIEMPGITRTDVHASPAGSGLDGGMYTPRAIVPKPGMVAGPRLIHRLTAPRST